MAALWWKLVLITCSQIISVHAYTCELQEHINATDNTQFFIDYLGTRFDVSVYPLSVDQLIEGNTAEVVIHYTTTRTSPSSDVESHSLELRVLIEDAKIATVSSPSQFLLTNPPLQANLTLTIKGVFLGRTHLLFYYRQDDGGGADTNINDKYGVSESGKSDGDVLVESGVRQHDNTLEWILADVNYDVVVIRGKKLLNDIFIVVVVVMVLIANVGMGCIIELKEVKEVLRRPVAPLIGFLCQFVIMPVVSICNTIPDETDSSVGTNSPVAT